MFEKQQVRAETVLSEDFLTQRAGFMTGGLKRWIRFPNPRQRIACLNIKLPLRATPGSTARLLRRSLYSSMLGARRNESVEETVDVLNDVHSGPSNKSGQPESWQETPCDQA